MGLQWLPSSVVDMGLSMVADDVIERAGFDPRKLRPLLAAPHCHCPAIFGSGEQDCLVLPEQVRALHNAWGGQSELVLFSGDHNGERPKEFLQQSARFMWDTLSAAAKAESKMSAAVDAYFSGSPPPARRNVCRRKSDVANSLLASAVSDYVDQNHGMEKAIRKYQTGGGLPPVVDLSALPPGGFPSVSSYDPLPIPTGPPNPFLDESDTFFV
ncbi:unnamed protein product [Polarella glacialis]|uniref:Uncharacterized protein n=1 Tax=Polarella glacialis TaxID=89957 RepID=A0A813LWG5_POLGL|nr:unnamed protein product [Polarella glacialis]CAE8740200.1 unnamed protein product [Polarella glacialis]